jgi:tRNA A37 threonylcarbamoyladenosine dehydratase
MDPFAKDVRKHLRRKYGIGESGPTGITAVYSVEPPVDPVALQYDQMTCGFLCVCPHKENDFHTCDHRTQINGSVAFVTSVFGMHAAAIAVKALAARAPAAEERPVPGVAVAAQAAPAAQPGAPLAE